MPKPYIDTIKGKAYFLKTIKEKNGRWDDHWSTIAGEFVIHRGDEHDVYIVGKKPKKTPVNIKKFKEEMTGPVTSGWGAIPEKHFYDDKDEYRWEFPTIGQGHYFLAKDLKDAKRKAVMQAKSTGLYQDEIVLQKWKPKRGKKHTIMLV